MGEGVVPDPALRDELHRKVGRNLLTYQAIELAMKYLVADALVEGTPDSVAENARRRTEKVMVQTMGQIVGALFEQVLTDSPKHPPMVSSPTQIQIRSVFNVEPGQTDGWAPLMLRAQNVLAARNELVHHLLRQWPRGKDEELRALLEHLDTQHADAEPLRRELADLIRHQGEARAELGAELARRFSSPDWEAEFQTQVACGNVAAGLQEVAEVSSRPDGWVVLSGALSRLHGETRLKKDVDLLTQRWGKKWWNKLFEQSVEEFERSDEPMPNATDPNQRRLLYRVRSAASE